MPAKGPSLNIDPRYLDFAISVWRQEDFASLPLAEFEANVAERASVALNEFNLMGLAKEQVKPSLVKSAITLFKSMKLAKSVPVGPRDVRATQLAITPLGREVLSEPPAIGGIHRYLVSILVSVSPPLAALLKYLNDYGPLSRPISSPIPGTPRKGAAYNRALLAGLVEYSDRVGGFGTQQHMHPASGRQKQTASQRLKEAITEATKRHPVSTIAGVEKIIPLAAALGLLWIDRVQVNEALGIESVGTATTQQDGAVFPNAPDWRTMSAQFTELLLNTHFTRMYGSGFSSIDALRGGVGRVLRLSPPVVDALICRARVAGDRGESPVRLQFEANDDLSYTPGRRPLIWENTAFDFVEVRRPSTPDQVGSNSTAHIIR
jgi:hypothetical protein